MTISAGNEAQGDFGSFDDDSGTFETQNEREATTAGAFESLNETPDTIEVLGESVATDTGGPYAGVTVERATALVESEHLEDEAQEIAELRERFREHLRAFGELEEVENESFEEEAQRLMGIINAYEDQEREPRRGSG